MQYRFPVVVFFTLVFLSRLALAQPIPDVTAIVSKETISQTMQNGQKWRYSNGDVYEGQWRNNLPDGKGRYIHFNGDEYVGQFVNGRFQGEGEYRFSNGDVYKGGWTNGEMSGDGVMLYQNGNRYSGHWKNGMRDGKGELSYRSGSFYKGYWVNDERSGKGFSKFANGERYVGDFVHNQPHGYGVRVDSNGNVYRGTFSHGRRHGVGECHRPGGVVHVCLFDRGREILDPAKLELAKAYFKKHQPIYDFNGGIAYHLEDEYTRARYYVTSSQVWWERTDAMLSNQLRIRSEDDNQIINIVINDYTGPGVYHPGKGNVTATSRSGDKIVMTDDSVARVEIKSDDRHEVNGFFSVTRLVDISGKKPRYYQISGGRFQAEDQPPQVSGKESPQEKYLVEDRVRLEAAE